MYEKHMYTVYRNFSECEYLLFMIHFLPEKFLTKKQNRLITTKETKKERMKCFVALTWHTDVMLMLTIVSINWNENKNVILYLSKAKFWHMFVKDEQLKFNINLKQQFSLPTNETSHSLVVRS